VTVITALKEVIADPQFPQGVAWQRHHFKQDEVVIREGDEGRSLFLIEEGELRVSGRVKLEQERRIQPGICDIQTGDIFGEICLYETHMRTATVTAISTSTVLELDGARLSIYLDAHPVQGYLFLKELFATVAGRLNQANRRVENLFAWGLKAHGIEKFL